MIKKFKIGSTRISFVLHHRWEKGANSPLQNYEANQIRNEYNLGLYLKKRKAVGSVKRESSRGETIKKTFSDDNLVPIYWIGFNLIVLKFWFEIKFKPTL